MPKTRINCPNCRQPILADLDQLFDAGSDPTAKQRLLSGAYNLAQCPNCGFQGNLATPLVYHDPDKELLLTFFPPEVGLPRDEQERLIGALINQAVNKLPVEKRKGYLLRPQSTLTMQGLIERILEADGITREMLQAQQARMNLLQRLLGASPEARGEIAAQEDKLIDAEFFTLLRRLVEASLAGGDRQSAQMLADLQKAILPHTTFGRQIEEQTREVEAAIASLREVGQEMTREKLLDLVEKAPNEIRLSALVSLARGGMDYQFFQTLSERIDKARGDGRARLIELREKLLTFTRQIDEQMEARLAQTRKLIEAILQEADIPAAVEQSLPAVDETFVSLLESLLEEARKKGDLERSARIQKVMEVIQELSMPPEVAFITELVDAPDEAARRALLEANREQITQEFLDALFSILGQVEGSGDKEMAARVKAVHNQALRYSMELKLRGG
ncbi:MAG: hypothetical protein L0Z70_06355 [Chloroflexi bacterium]|nr:hypothetical protein [Chloroflexota bacterium]